MEELGYKNKYRKHIVTMLDTVYDELSEFYENSYKEAKEREDVMGLYTSEYYKDEDGLFVLNNVNGEDSLHFENIVNLTGLETFIGSTFVIQPFVVDFIYGRYLPSRKNMLELSDETCLTLVDINFSTLNKFANKLSLPETCFKTDKLDKDDNVINLAWLSNVDFPNFIISKSPFTLQGLQGVCNCCNGSKFGTLNLSHCTKFYGSLKGEISAYFVKCNISSLIISSKSFLNVGWGLFESCTIEELIIYDSTDIDLDSELYRSYVELMEESGRAIFTSCEIGSLSISSNVILSNMFSLCTINKLAVVPRNPEEGIQIDSNALLNTVFTCVQNLNVSRLGQSAFNACVVNVDSTKLSRPFVLYVKSVPDRMAVADAINGFLECAGDYEVLDCTGDGVNSSVQIFSDNKDVSDDVVYNTLYAMLFRGSKHYIELPEDMLENVEIE